MTYEKLRGWKYRTIGHSTFDLSSWDWPRAASVVGRVLLTSDGMLYVTHGYAWDGPSGPAIDTRNFMCASLAHDALYQLIREGKLPRSCRSMADDVLVTICRKHGMSRPRAWWVGVAVRMFGWGAVRPRHSSRTMTCDHEG